MTVRRAVVSRIPRHWLVLLLLTLGVAGGALWLLTRLPPTTYSLGVDGDQQYHANFYPREADELHTFRWSSTKSHVLLHGTGTTPVVAAFRVFSDPAHPKTVTLQATRAETDNPGPIYAAFATAPQPGWRDYAVLLPRHAISDATLHAVALYVNSDPIHRPGENDGRKLGVPLASVHVTPVVAPPAMGGMLYRAGVLAWLVLLVGGGLLWLRQTVRPTVSPWWAVGGAAVVAGGVLAALFLRPYWLAMVLPATPWALGLATLVLAGVSLASRRLPARWQQPAALGSVVLLAVAAIFLYTQMAVLAGVLLAGTAVVLLVLLAPALPTPGDGQAPALARRTERLLLGGIVLVALGLRFVQLDVLPYGLWRDEARHGLFALRIADSASYRPVYIASGGVNMPALGLYPFALALELWGVHIWTMRVFTALAGALTVLPLYALVRRLFGRGDVALLAAALLAFSSWHIAISRFSFPTVFDPLLTLTGLWLLLAALEYTGRRRWLALLAAVGAGLCIGIALQTYHSGRVAVLLAGTMGGLWLVAHRARWRTALLCGGATLVGLLLISSPYIVYALDNPSAFNDRVGDVALISEKNLQGQPMLAVLDDSLGRHMLMFHAQGDRNSRHHAPDLALLDPLTGIGMLAGLALLLRAWRDWRTLWLASGMLWGLAPSLFAVNGPHAMRAIGALALAVTLAALGWWYLLRLLPLAVPRVVQARRAMPIAAAVVLGVALVANSWVYFQFAPSEPRVWTSFYPIHTQMGSYVRDYANTRAGDATQRLYVHERLAENAVFAYLTYGLPISTFGDDGLDDAPPPDALLVFSGYSYHDDVDRFAEYLGSNPQPVAVGPLLPDRVRPAFVVYAVRAAESDRP